MLARCGISGMQIAGNTLAEKSAREVVYYQANESPYDLNVRRVDSHGGWLATAADLVQFLVQVDGRWAGHRVLTPESLREMTTGTAANPGYAKGWAINKVPNWWHT